jgi:hypothetical protein
MGALRPLGIGRRPVSTRLLVLYRAAPELVQAFLPAGARVRMWREHGFVGLCYTRLEKLAHRWIPHGLAASFDHLACRVPAEFDAPGDPLAGSWVLHRRTSSWFGARWAGALHRAEVVHSRFDVERSPFGLELRVSDAQGEQLYLKSEPAPALAGSLFRTHREAEVFLAAGKEVRPADAFAPEADDLELESDSFAAEPHRLLDIRAPMIEKQGGLDLRAFELDCALLLTNKRVVPLSSPSTLRRGLEDRGDAAPALPGALASGR